MSDTTPNHFDSMPRTEDPLCQTLRLPALDKPSLFEAYHGRADVVIHTETTTEADGRPVSHIIAFHLTGRMIVTQADDPANGGLQDPIRMNLAYAFAFAKPFFDHWWHYEDMRTTKSKRMQLLDLTNARN